MDEVYVEMAASPIDISLSCRAIPQCNLHPTPTHLLHSFQIITCCTEAASMRRNVFKYLPLRFHVQASKKQREMCD